MTIVFNLSNLPDRDLEQPNYWITVFEVNQLYSLARGQRALILIDEVTNRQTLKELIRNLTNLRAKTELVIVSNGYPLIKNRYFDILTVAKIQPKYFTSYLNRKLGEDLCLSQKSTPWAEPAVIKSLA